MNIVTLSSKQQVILPQADRERIILSPMRQSVVSRVAGSLLKYVSPAKRNIPFELVMRETKKLAAQKLAREK